MPIQENSAMAFQLNSASGSGVPGHARQELTLVNVGDEDDWSRRDFLKLAGFAVAGATLAGCQRAPVQYAVPYLIAPEELIPGNSYEYSSTCGGCSAGCGIRIKNRDGRPIKLEGNPEHPLSQGGLCAAGQASLLGIYDQQRLQKPMHKGEPTDWQSVDKELTRQLEAIRKKEKAAVRFLSGPGVGPAVRASIKQFLSTFADGKHVVSDARSCSAILDAHARTHGARLLPHYHLDKAQIIVGIDADFLGTWISPVEFTAAYQAGRHLDGDAKQFSYHVQFESLLSLTGSKADQRRIVTPSELASVIKNLTTRLSSKAGKQAPEGLMEESLASDPFLDTLAKSLWENQGKSLILCGSQDVELQVLTNYLNELLGNYGTSVDLAQPSYQRDGNDRELEALIKEIREGKIAALFIYQSNPVHDLPNGDRIAQELNRVPLLVSLSSRLDETAELAEFVCPDSHYLESWGDAEPINGLASLQQPVINPIGKTRPVMESLAAWTGKPRSGYDILREHWEKEVYTRRTKDIPFAQFWDETLQNGFASIKPQEIKIGPFRANEVRLTRVQNRASEGDYSLVLYSKVGMPDSGHAYNPWLHELPDPISKVTWDNYACVSPATAEKLGLVDGDVVDLEIVGGANQPGLKGLPVLVQMGQHDRVIGVALGYGSQITKRFAKIGPQWLQSKPTVGPNGMVGINAAPLLKWVDGTLRPTGDNVRLTKTGGLQQLASTQSYNLLTVPPRFASGDPKRRTIVKETTLKDYQKELAHKPSSEAAQKNDDLWPADDHPSTDPRWGMVIDLQACTGCSACVIACQAENNTPIVGKDEVFRQREMHWLRIDRYYTKREGGVDVAHQPMLCQQCGNAPCEVVCPVLATVHSQDGLNQQVYNRCVGTRYCANNCPYKVRRFNWFEYAHDDALENLALNPDVTVRSRGVMEKCTFCVQRIQEGRREAGGGGQIPPDGSIQTACQQSCPAKAIVFGNLKDPISRVSKWATDRRSYQVLGELNVQPAVNYLALVRNHPVEGKGEKDG
jgi:molybdopterin-containing oxidoreductase family iron-sulfur binding subunit